MSTPKHTLFLKTPASWWGAKWREALPSGNGHIGAAVYGGVYEETVMLSHEHLWRKGKSPDMPDVSDKLPEVRKLLLGGQPRSADRILADTLKERGYKPRIGSPIPLGDLKLVMPGKQAFKRYSRSLNMETGEITVRWTDGDTTYERRLFVSRSDDMIVYDISRQGPGTIQAALGLELHDVRDVRKPDTRIPDRVETIASGQWLTYAAANDESADFGAVAKVTALGGVVREDGAKLRIEHAERVLICVKLFASGARASEWERLQAELETLAGSYETLLAPHAEEHGRIFSAMQFDLHAEGREAANEELLLDAYQGEAPPALMEKMWAYGRYLLVSSTRAGGYPCHLYGLWCGEYEGMWAFHMVNENLQMIYWQALSGNMPELLLSVFNYVEAYMDDFRHNASRLYGCRGIYIPAPLTPDSGRLKHVTPHIIHWTGGAGWIAQHYYDYYKHTGDLTFLKERALPFLRETALFYEDFFIPGEDGYWMTCPSNSPENTPGNYWNVEGESKHMETTANATMDFAIAKEVFANLIEGAEKTGLYAGEINRWQAVLDKIPPYQINEDGAVREWMHPDFADNYHHRHQSHLYPVFPGTEVTRDSDPQLFEAFVTAVQKRLVIGLKEQSGWSLAHMACNYARMGDGDAALECLDILSRSCVINNLFTLHNDWRHMGIGVDSAWAPFQIDANMGWTAAVQEMLLFSLPGAVRVFPALPGRWRRGEAGPLLARGGVEVTLQWDQDRGEAVIELVSRTGSQTIELLLPDSRRTVSLGANEPVKLKERIGFSR